MARVIVSVPANSDILDILDYLASKAGYATAERYAAAFKAAYRRLSDFPGSGSPRPALGERVRIASIQPFVVIYEHADDGVTILRVLHGKRDITQDLVKQRSGL